jgi:hypothetical protein
MRSAIAGLGLVLACTSNSGPKGRDDDSPASVERSPSPGPAPVVTGRTVAVPGLTITVPASWVPESPEQLAAARAGMAAEVPADATFALDGAHAADGPQAGLVFLHRLDASRDSSARSRTVRQALTRMREDMETRIVADGGEIVRSEFSERASGIEGCFAARMHHPRQTVEIRTCARLAHSSLERLASVQVMCMADAARVESVCAPILAGLQYDAGAVIGLDEVLAANVAPPVAIGGGGEDRVAGVLFGMSRAEFTGACAAAGFKVDAVDMDAETPATRAWFAEGRMSQCEGLPGGAGFGLGEVERVIAVFVEGRLAVATLELAAPLAEVEAKLAAAYPEFVFTPARMIYRIDDEARGDRLLRVGLEALRDRSGSAVHFSSERGAHAPAIAVPR